MRDKLSVLRKITLLEKVFISIGLIALACYFAKNLISLLIFCILCVFMLFQLVWIVVYVRKAGLYFSLFFISTIGLDLLIESEVFKSTIVLSASLDNDLSTMGLYLREDNSFNLNVNYILGQDKYLGEYSINDDTIFLSFKESSEIPISDTLYFNNFKTKIFMGFDKNGSPIYDFARYFVIRENQLTD